MRKFNSVASQADVNVLYEDKQGFLYHISYHSANKKPLEKVVLIQQSSLTQ